MLERLLEVNQIAQGSSKGSVSLIDQINEGLPATYGYGLGICFDECGNYLGVKSRNRPSEVVYMSGPPNGCDPTVVSKFSGTTTRVVGRLKKSLQALTASPITQELHPLLSAIMKSYDQDAITQDVQEKLDALDIKGTYPYVFVAVSEAIDPLYLKKCVQDYMLDYVLGKYSVPSASKKDCSLLAENRCCSVCGSQGKLVYGNFSRLACYNLDKKGMISGGFDYSRAVANFPVCKECVVGISAGVTFAEKYLTFSLCGERYLLLPSVKDKEMRGFVLKTIQEEKNRSTLTNDVLTHITHSEKELLKELALTCEDTITLSMIFFEQQNAAWRITAEILEILPSRIQEVYKAKQYVEKNPVMKLSKKDENEGYHFTLKTLLQFTGPVRHVSKKKFMAYVDAVFSGRSQVEEAVLLADIVRSILSVYKQSPNSASFVVRDAWATYKFLNKLNILRRKGDVMASLTRDSSPYSKFLEENRDFFGKKEKAVAFLTGCYVNSVLYVQYNNLGSEPFLKKLRGLKLDRKRLQAIYPEARNKLQQYDSLGLVSKLDPLLAQSWVDCAGKWEISDDEATFAFTLGLSLSRKIRQHNQDDNQVTT